MAKKKSTRPATPSFFLTSPAPVPLPGVRPLFLPALLVEAAGQVNQYLSNECAHAHDAFKKWIGDIEAGVLDAQTETQVEQDFYKVLLKSLGYTTSGDVTTGQPWTLQTKWSEIGADKADATLGHFQLGETGVLVGHPLVCVELKGATKDLDRKDAKGRSAVQQAWDYLNSSETAKWAIVSNYREIRLYSRERPNRCLHRVVLTDLKIPDAFERFYAVFHAGSLLGTGSLALNASTLLEKTGIRQDVVGEELYQFYAENRTALIGEIQRHRETTLDVAIQTAQKLLDRILFIAFAQSRHLLSDSSLLKNTAEMRVAGLSRWMAFQLLFKAIDRGDEFNGVPKYNGNLFKPDPILDDPSFILDSDRWPNVFQSMGNYDYQNEVTVDVLGRIFERSITDIEQIKSGGLSRHEAALDIRKAASGRKIHGVYYTAAYIVEYLVGAALEPLQVRHKADLMEALGLDENLSDPPPAAFTRGMLQWLDSLTVCDPACGSGAFLIALYNWFEPVRLDLLTDLQRAEPDAPECHDAKGFPGDIRDWLAFSAPLILKNNIHGVDISPESVEIAQLSLWIRTARRDRSLADLSANIRCGNSVVDDPEVDKAHAFDWQASFPKVFAKGGFDAIVGNPPYVRQERLAAFKEHFSKRYKAFSGAADLYVYFYEKGVELLKPDGRLAFISSGTFVKGAFAAPLRTLLSSEASLDSLIDFGEFQPFPEAEMVRPSCVVLKKGNSTAISRVLKFLGKDIPPRDLAKAIDESGINMTTPNNTDGDWQLEIADTVALLKKLLSHGESLKTYCEGTLFRGVVTGLNEVFVITAELKDQLISKDPKSKDIIHPFIQGTHLRPWYQEESEAWLIFTQRGIDIEKYPAIKAYLEEHRRSLEPRPDQWSPTEQNPTWLGRKPGSYKWYEIQDAIDYAPSFQSTKIVFPDIAKLPRSSMDHRQHFLGNTAYVIALEDFYLLGVLNSTVSRP